MLHCCYIRVTSLKLRCSPLQLDPERVPMGMGSGFMWDKEVRMLLLCYEYVSSLLLLSYKCYMCSGAQRAISRAPGGLGIGLF
jgi:hypothetical protein